MTADEHAQIGYRKSKPTQGEASVRTPGLSEFDALSDEELDRKKKIAEIKKLQEESHLAQRSSRSYWVAPSATIIAAFIQIVGIYLTGKAATETLKRDVQEIGKKATEAEKTLGELNRKVEQATALVSRLEDISRQTAGLSSGLADTKRRQALLNLWKTSSEVHRQYMGDTPIPRSNYDSLVKLAKEFNISRLPENMFREDVEDLRKQAEFIPMSTPYEDSKRCLFWGILFVGSKQQLAFEAFVQTLKGGPNSAPMLYGSPFVFRTLEDFPDKEMRLALEALQEVKQKWQNSQLGKGLGPKALNQARISAPLLLQLKE